MFDVTFEDAEKIRKWKDTLPVPEDIGAIGGAYTYCFTPTGLGVIFEVKRFDGHTLDLTDSDTW